MNTTTVVGVAQQIRGMERRERHRVRQAYLEEIKSEIRRDESTYGALASELRRIFIYMIGRRLVFPNARGPELPSEWFQCTDMRHSQEWAYTRFCDMSCSITSGRFSDVEVNVIFAELLEWLNAGLLKSYRSEL